ncbi:MAG: insulinase family protein [Deltaproteobacteria bacterium]|nr:insulinase family protein [Deltaproteobacteria bacterium]
MAPKDLVAIALLTAGCAATPSPTVGLLARVNHRIDRSERIRLAAEATFGAGQRISKFELPNGLRIIVSEDHAAPVFSYHTWFRVGSRNEREGKTGLAHLFEHLMFNETESLRAGEFDRILEQAGGESNAATWVDWTFYHENLPSSKLDLAVRLEADRMQHLVLQDPQVTSEKEVVANERRYSVDDSVEGSLNELLYKTAFSRHPYHWPTIGWMSDIESFDTADCRSFYRTYYAPNNATLVVVGDVDTARLLRLVRRHYGSIARQGIPGQEFPREPRQRRERRVTVEKPVAADRLQVGWRGPALSDPDHVALTVANEVLFGGRSSRLYRSLVTRLEIASSARGWVSTFADPGLYEVFVELRQGHRAAEAERVIATAVSGLRRELVPDQEMEKARSRLELQFLQGLTTAGGKAEQLGFHETTLGDFRTMFDRLEAIRNVTAEDVRRAARRFLRRTNRTAIVAVPEPPGGGPSPAAGTEAGRGSE